MDEFTVRQSAIELHLSEFFDCFALVGFTPQGNVRTFVKAPTDRDVSALFDGINFIEDILQKRTKE